MFRNIIIILRCIKMLDKASIFLLITILSGCVFPDHSGFYNPVTMSMAVPDGPPEYKAGWHAGCKTGSSIKSFANSWVFQTSKGPDFGTGVYVHDPVYQTGWGQGWFSCSIYGGNFVNRFATEHSPLQ